MMLYSTKHYVIIVIETFKICGVTALKRLLKNNSMLYQIMSL